MTTADLAAALVLGLVGAPHCVAMCGGIVALAQAPVGVASAPGVEAARVHLPLVVAGRDGGLVGLVGPVGLVGAQSAGRLMIYASGGAIVGGLGSIAAAVSIRGVQSILEVVSGVVMVATALLVAGTLPARASIERLGVPVWKRLEPLARRRLPLRTSRDALLFGAVWGFLPCGLVYSALAMAAGSGSLASGATTMLAFGAGTLPALVAMGALAGALRRVARHRAARVGVVILLAAFGVQRLERGLRPTPACVHCGG
jgi:uncharacterized protein